MKIEIIFEIPTIENPKIDITHDYLGYTPPSPPGGALGGRSFKSKN